MRSQRGASLLELLAMLAVAGIAVTLSVIGSLGWIHRQASRSAVYHVQAMLQAARSEAVARNRACQLRVEPGTRTLRIVDLNLAGSSDDVRISATELSRTTQFDRPDSGDAVDLPLFATGVHEATFEADGTVSSGAGGEIVLRGGDDYYRITLYGAGGVRVERWDHNGWSGSLR